jgi:hypothetical protein
VTAWKRKGLIPAPRPATMRSHGSTVAGAVLRRQRRLAIAAPSARATKNVARIVAKE